MNDIQFKKSYSALINPNYGVASTENNKQNLNVSNKGNSDFAKIFNKVLENNEKLTFSKHALQRINQRNIEISQKLISSINTAVERAKSKGIKDALILSNKTAFIVNIPSSTVVTAMSGSEMSDNIFTNIDGAVLI